MRLDYIVYQLENNSSFFVPEYRESNIDKLLRYYNVKVKDKVRMNEYTLGSIIGFETDLVILMLTDYDKSHYYNQENVYIHQDTYQCKQYELTIYIPPHKQDKQRNADKVYDELISKNVVNELLDWGLSLKDQSTDIKLLIENKESI